MGTESPNAALVRNFYTALAKKDAEILAELVTEHFAEDASLTWPDSLPYGGTVAGAKKLQRLFQGLAGAPAAIGPGNLAVAGIVDGGDSVAADLTFDWYVPGTSDFVPSGALELWRFVDGKVSTIRAFYWDTAELARLTDSALT